MKVKKFVVDCSSGTCIRREVRDECEKCGKEDCCPDLKCGKCGGKKRPSEFKIPNAFESAKSALFYPRHLLGVCSGIKERLELLGIHPKVDLRVYRDAIQFAQDEIVRQVSFGNVSRHSAWEITEAIKKAAESSELVKRIIQDLEKTQSALDQAFDERIGKAKGFSENEAKNFSGGPVKVYPTSRGNAKGAKMERKTKIFKDGQWQEAIYDDTELADRITHYLKENPGVPYETAAVACEVAMRGEAGEKHFAEGGTQSFTEKNSHVPQQVVREFSEIPPTGGNITYSRDGKWCRLTGGQILPVDTEGDEEIRAFQEQSERPQRFIPSTARKPDLKRGYSSDGKTFVTQEGQEVKVYQGSENENDEVEIQLFVTRFQNAIQQAGIPQMDLRKTVIKAIGLLRASGVESSVWSSAAALAALRAAFASKEKFEAAERYVKSGAFSSLEKAVAVALA